MRIRALLKEAIQMLLSVLTIYPRESGLTTEPQESVKRGLSEGGSEMEIRKYLSVNEEGNLIEMGSNLNVSEYSEKWGRAKNLDEYDLHAIYAAFRESSAPENTIHIFLIAYRENLKPYQVKITKRKSS